MKANYMITKGDVLEHTGSIEVKNSAHGLSVARVICQVAGCECGAFIEIMKNNVTMLEVDYEPGKSYYKVYDFREHEVPDVCKIEL